MSIAVVGDSKFGGVRMRGYALARHLNCPFFEPSQIDSIGHFDQIVAIKQVPSKLRSKCRRFVWDPLNAFKDKFEVDHHNYWVKFWGSLQFDDIIATSNSCYDLMRSQMPASVVVHTVPHQADTRPDPSWHDPSGPIVYTGLKHFVESRIDDIRQCCEQLGKQFVDASTDVSVSECNALREASLALCLRLPPTDTFLNRHCKPLVKVENALAAGLPVVSTDDPCVLSMHKLATVPPDFTVPQLAVAIGEALCRPVPPPFTENDYLRCMEQVLNV